MEDFETQDAYEDSGNKTGSKLLGLIALVIGAVGIAAGIGGILMAGQAKGELENLRKEMASKPDKVPELESRVEEIDERLVKLGSELVKLTRQDSQIRDDTQKAFDSVTGEMRKNRAQLNDLTDRLSQIAEKIENLNQRPKPANTTTSTSGASSSGNSADNGTVAQGGNETASEEAPEDGVYTINSGDTLSKIAKKFGITLNQLLNANPGINPRGLQIGQKIMIPED